jgi:hypothetical protein
MSILNAKLNQWAIWVPQDFFYPEIRERWTPVVNRLKLPYLSLEDYINATVQSITFPEVILPQANQPQTMFNIKYRGGKELEPTLDKNITITFKLSEGFISYWMFFDQIELFQKYSEKSPFWPSIFVSFLDHHGFEIMSFEFQKTLPLHLSQFNVSYASVAADFNTFSLNLSYNRFKIARRLNDKIYTPGKNE